MSKPQVRKINSDKAKEGIKEVIPDQPIPKVNEDQIQRKTIDAKISSSNLDALIHDKGYRVRITKVVPKPNLRISPNLGSSIGNNNHILSDNVGRNSFIAVETFEDFAALTQNNLNRMFKAEGFFDSSSFSLTVKSGILLNEFDLIEFPDILQEYYELIERDRMRGGNKVDRLTYTARNITHVIQVKGEKVIHFDLDQFKITTDGDIEWISNDRPEKGAIYAIRYRYEDSYRVVQRLHDNRINYESFRKNKRTPIRLPSSYVVKKDYLVFEKEREREDTRGQDA